MNMRRLYGWFFVALALLSAAHVCVSLRGRASHALIVRTVLLAEPIDDVSSIAIEKRGDAPVSFVKNGRWELEKPYAAQVDKRLILRLLDAFSTAFVKSSFDEVELSRLGKVRADFGLDEPRAQVTLSLSSGKDVSYAIGMPTPGGKGVYVRLDGENAIYVVDVRVWECVNLPAGAYRKKSLFADGVAENPTSFDVRRGLHAFSRFTCRKGVWTCAHDGNPDAVRVVGARVDRFLKALQAAETESFVWPVGASNEPAVATASLLAGYGLDSESAVTVTLRGPGGIDGQVSFGSAASSNLVYALVQNASAIARVPAELRESAAAADFSDPRVYPFERDAVERLRLEDADAVYSLFKSADGEWRLDSPVSAPADASAVETLLSTLLALQSPLQYSTNEVMVSVSLGTVKETGPVARIPRSRLLQWASLDNLRSRCMLSVPPAEVCRLVFSHRGSASPLALVCDGARREWVVEHPDPEAGAPPRIDPAALAAILDELHPLRAERLVKLKVQPADLRRYGLEDPRVTVGIDLTAPGSVRRNILIGDVVENGAYATIGAADAVFVLSDRAVRAFLAPLSRTMER